MNFMWGESRAKNPKAENLKEQKAISGLSKIGYFSGEKEFKIYFKKIFSKKEKKMKSSR